MTDGLPGLFLSYARADDEPFVRKLRTDLTARGYRVWFDKADMPNRGVQFPREIAIAVTEHLAGSPLLASAEMVTASSP